MSVLRLIWYSINLVILFAKRVRYVKKVKNHWFRLIYQV